MTTADFPRLVLDANIMVSALIGRTFPFLLRLFEEGVLLLAPVQQLAETRRTLTSRPGVSEAWTDAQMGRLNEIVMAIHPALLDGYEERARRRLGPRGQPDWPLVAATYVAGGAAWSHDKDLFGAGIPVWSTKVLMREMNYA